MATGACQEPLGRNDKYLNGERIDRTFSSDLANHLEPDTLCETQTDLLVAKNQQNNTKGWADSYIKSVTSKIKHSFF